MKKTNKVLLVLMLILISPINTFGENNINYTAKEAGLSISEKIICDEENFFWFPLRDILEEIGCQIEWDGDKREISICNGDEHYICVLYENYGEKSLINFYDIMNDVYYRSENYWLYLKLNPWDSSGNYRIINDTTYTYETDMRRLLAYMGYGIDTNNSQLIPISEMDDYEYKDFREMQKNREAQAILSMLFEISEDYFTTANFSLSEIDDKLEITMDFNFRLAVESCENEVFGKETVKLLSRDKAKDIIGSDTSDVYVMTMDYKPPFEVYIVDRGEYYQLSATIPHSFILYSHSYDN